MAAVSRPYVANVMGGFHKRSSDSGMGGTCADAKLSTRKRVSIEFFCALSVCLRFLAEGFPADGARVPSLVEQKARRRATLTGSLSVCHHAPQNEAKKRRNSGQLISAPSPIDRPVMPPFVSVQVMTLTHPGQPSSQAAMAGLGFCFIASTCSFMAFFMSLTEGSALWVAIIQL
jgi:hypothetical protein